MRKVAALAAVTALLAPVSSAAAQVRKHPYVTAKSRCSAVQDGHATERGSRRCKAAHRMVRAQFAIVKAIHSGGDGQSSPVAPRPHFAPPSAPMRCDLFASPSGSDDQGDGSAGSPFASVRKLDRALAPGQTGCLRGGIYGDTSTWHELAHSGTASARITITAYPGESPTVVGWIDIEASYTTVSHLNVDGSNTFYHASHPRPGCSSVSSEGLAIAGASDVFEYNNYYQGVAKLRSNGLGVGWTGSPDNAVVRFNKIHDVGQCGDYDHLIYLSHGNNVQIYDNWLWNDRHGWGVQLYPAPTNARVWGNVIDGAGAGFTVGNEQGQTVSGNRIFNNVVMSSTGLPTANLSGVAISDYWGGTRDTTNTFSNNDSFNNPGGVGRVSAVGLDNNKTTDPQFVDAPSHNYTLRSGSPAAGWSMWSGNVA